MLLWTWPSRDLRVGALNGACGPRVSIILALYVRPCLILNLPCDCSGFSLGNWVYWSYYPLCLYRTNLNGGLGVVIISLGYWGGMGSIAQGLHGEAIEPILGPVFDFYFGSFVPLTHEFRGDKR